MARKKARGRRDGQSSGERKQSRRWRIKLQREFFHDQASFKILHPKLYREFRMYCFELKPIKCSHIYDELRLVRRNYVDIWVKVKDDGEADYFNAIKCDMKYVDDRVSLWYSATLWRDVVYDLTPDVDQGTRKEYMQLIFQEMKNFKERSLSKGSYPDDSTCPIRLPKHLLVLVRNKDDVRQEFFSDKVRVNYVTEDFVSGNATSSK